MKQLLILFLSLECLSGCQIDEDDIVIQREYAEETEWKCKDGIVTHEKNPHGSVRFEWKSP